MPYVTRLRVVLASAAVVLAPWLVLTAPGTAGAAVSAAPAPTCPVLCVTSPLATASPTPSATPAGEASPTPSPVRPATSPPAPHRTPKAIASPRTRSTYGGVPGSTASPVTATIVVGRITPGPSEPLTALSPAEAAGVRQPKDPVARLVALVLGSAVLLGLGGATGLYLTRHRP